jgi:hypothetical protein
MPGYERRSLGPGDDRHEFPVPDTADNDGAFLLDVPEWSEEEWAERPRCGWAWNAGWRYVTDSDGTSRKMQYPSYQCPNEPIWREQTTYANALKTTSYHCHKHSLGAHESTQRWANIDHNTKGDTVIYNMRTEEKCPCHKGDMCALAEEWHRLHPPQIRPPADADAEKVYNL